MQQIDVTIKRHKWGWIGHTLRKDEFSVARQAMQGKPLDGIGRKNGDLIRPGDELCKRVQESKQNLA